MTDHSAHMTDVLQAQLIENWTPLPEFAFVLREFDHGRINEASAIANLLDLTAELAEERTAQKRPFLTRLTFNQPYLDCNWNVMENLVDLHSMDGLWHFEAAASTVRMRTIANRRRFCVDASHKTFSSTDQARSFILRRHEELFQDSYTWAGQIRTVGIAKPGIRFPATVVIPDLLTIAAEALANATKATDLKSRGNFLCEFVSYYTWAHPFRDGNGRTAMSILMDFAHPAAFSSISRHEWQESSRLSLANADHDDLRKGIAPQHWQSVIDSLLRDAS